MFKADGAAAQIARDRAEGRTSQRMTHPLDSEPAIALHRRLLAIYRFELERQLSNRLEMATDEDFYDHIQWSAEEISELNNRGQYPLVMNLIQTTVNWVLGTQRRSLQDYKILPRRKDGLESAERKSELLRHLRDENYEEQKIAMAFTDAVKAGIGWLETGQGDPADGPIVFSGSESWRNMLWDSRGTEGFDTEKGRYIIRSKWLDADTGAAMWPDRQALIEQSREHLMIASGTSDYGDEPMDSIEDDSESHASIVTAGGSSLRDRIRVMEVWFKKPTMVPVMSGGDFSRELFDEYSQGHWHDLKRGAATLVLRPRQVMNVALMTERGLLSVQQSPYRHNRFPFTAVWGYRRARDGMPYGLIRGLRGPQKDLNKRASKALHHLSTNRVYVEEGAVDDIEELRDEANRPDSVIVSKAGRKEPRIENNTEVAQAHMELMSIDAQMIQQVGGVTDENLGRKTNASSGKAIVARQDQGALATSHFFDNLRVSLIQHGEKKLVNIEQFYTEEQQFRITDSRGNPKYITINDPSGRNSIDVFKADFVITEEDWRATTRQAQAETLVDLLSQLAPTSPEVVMAVLDLVVESLDVPKRDEMVKRVRQITGQADPDEDPNNPSPETIAMQEQKAEQADMQKRAADAELREKEAKASKSEAEAKQISFDLRGAPLKHLKDAIDAAMQIAGAPAVGQAVDQLMQRAKAEADADLMNEQPQQDGMQMPSPAMGSTPPQQQQIM
ncbi:hypothetical protein PAF17_16005 [Paracoccus sp. Z330]|uniref:Portal protein n=1 Tax=Paracoccus onchidii TaxID=3017813 RepID=A0ABT4ZJT5_9RHOB|nr:hypothetical protein [Paracoccus onchidii]MDB6178996.1 hypothetical protein [Paracoccus onchidii]